MDTPVRRPGEHLSTAGERPIDVLGPPERSRADLSDGVHLPPLVSGLARMQKGAVLEVGCRLPVLRPKLEPSEESQRIPRASVVLGFFEHDDERFHLAPDPRVRPRALGLYVYPGEPDLGAGAKRPVADACGRYNSFLEQRLGFAQPPGFQQRLPELDLDLDPRPVAFLQ